VREREIEKNGRGGEYSYIPGKCDGYVVVVV
jgi:hypothetical protein